MQRSLSRLLNPASSTRQSVLPVALLLLLLKLCLPAQENEAIAKRQFYIPANPKYTILDSARDSVRFTLEKTLRRDEHNHLVSISSFVDPEGQIMGWHDFGNLEGPGWAANAVGGAY